MDDKKETSSTDWESYKDFIKPNYVKYYGDTSLEDIRDKFDRFSKFLLDEHFSNAQNNNLNPINEHSFKVHMDMYLHYLDSASREFHSALDAFNCQKQRKDKDSYRF